MSHKLLIEKFAKYQKMAQMGAGIRVKFHHPQYFAPSAKNQIISAVLDPNVSVEVYMDYVTFFDGSGTMGSEQLKDEAKKACAAVEQKMNLDLGELFNYKQIEAA